MDRGYMPIWRKLQDNPIWENNMLLSVWIRLLFKANHTKGIWWNGTEMVEINPGQFISSGPKLAEYFKIPRTTLFRKLKVFENLEMLDMKTDNQYTTITICNYTDYQEHIKRYGQLSGQQVDKQRTGGGQVVDTSKNVKNLKNVNIIISHLNKLTGKRFKSKTPNTISLINARLDEGYTIKDFKYVHEVKTKEWLGGEGETYLRPKTLYNITNFENYLNQTTNEKKTKPFTGKTIEPYPDMQHLTDEDKHE